MYRPDPPEETLGTFTDATDIGKWIGIDTTPKEYIVNIDGTATWTGTDRASGVEIKYKAVQNPHLNQIVVIFTITQESV